MVRYPDSPREVHSVSPQSAPRLTPHNSQIQADLDMVYRQERYAMSFGAYLAIVAIMVFMFLLWSGRITLTSHMCDKELIGTCQDSKSCQDNPELCQEYNCIDCIKAQITECGMKYYCTGTFDCNTKAVYFLVSFAAIMCLTCLAGSLEAIWIILKNLKSRNIDLIKKNN